KMDTLSMGCTLVESQCTKCGHVAVDETDLCEHIKYEKGNRFFYPNGQQGIVAELCGHHSLEGGGVNFIEASWVENPAFKGAVLRNTLNASEAPIEVQKQAEEVLQSPPPQWLEDSPFQKKAFDFGSEDEGEEEEPVEEPKDSLQEAEDELYGDMKRRVIKRIKDELKKEEEGSRPAPENSSAQLDSTLIKDAQVHRIAVATLIKTSQNDADFINRLSIYNEEKGIRIPMPVYRAALKLGSSSKYSSLSDFQKACREVLGYVPAQAEQRTLIRLSKLLSERSNKEN
ncbi:MAG: hypothetical protein AAGM67_01420, partial [Bacteroidota bacterium]